jgi:uncharacterized iron-regulated membrane protein
MGIFIILSVTGLLYFFYDTIQEYLNGNKSIAPAELKSF